VIVLQNAGVGATILPWRLRAPGPQAEVVVAGPRSSSGSVKRKIEKVLASTGRTKAVWRAIDGSADDRSLRVRESLRTMTRGFREEQPAGNSMLLPWMSA